MEKKLPSSPDSDTVNVTDSRRTNTAGVENRENVTGDAPGMGTLEWK